MAQVMMFQAIQKDKRNFATLAVLWCTCACEATRLSDYCMWVIFVVVFIDLSSVIKFFIDVLMKLLKRSSINIRPTWQYCREMLDIHTFIPCQIAVLMTAHFSDHMFISLHCVIKNHLRRT